MPDSAFRKEKVQSRQLGRSTSSPSVVLPASGRCTPCCFGMCVLLLASGTFSMQNTEPSETIGKPRPGLLPQASEELSRAFEREQRFSSRSCPWIPEQVQQPTSGCRKQGSHERVTLVLALAAHGHTKSRPHPEARREEAQPEARRRTSGPICEKVRPR